ncbi:MAG: DUF5320 domain-containing protein [Candidatus Aenigmarchaeota archaeon]|nr:DUF5320 domain-containing protein [Candidatus Aenigmarchaeota archaeon]
MPWGDRTGPNGAGPRTGRGLGYCSGYNSPGYTKGVPMGGRGFGRGGFGRGAGFGRGGWFEPAPYSYRPPTREQEIADLKAEKEAMQRELEDIEKRLKELEKKK